MQPSCPAFRALVLAAAAASIAIPARAQLLDRFFPSTVYGTEVEPEVTVTSRVRPGYDNGGVRVGSLLVRPLVSESAGYESNVLARSSPQGSGFLSTRASVDARSDGSRGTVAASGAVDDLRYLDLGRQSYADWRLGAGGSFELGRDTASLRFTHQTTHQTARGLDVPQLASPLAVATDRAVADYRATFSRLSLTPSIEVGRFRYDSGLVDGVGYDQGQRNRVVVTPGVVAAYELATRRSLVAVVRTASASYSNGTAASPRQNNLDVLVLAGVDYDLTGVLRARLLGGFERRTFTAAAFSTVEAPTAELSLVYNPTGLTTVTATVTRRIQDSADNATAAVTVTSGLLKVDHELRRNVVLSAQGGATRNDYPGRGQAQTLFGAGASANWLLNRYAAVGAAYDLLARDGELRPGSFSGLSTGGSYVDHRVSVQLRLAL